jgi:hypothetical protein
LKPALPPAFRVFTPPVEGWVATPSFLGLAMTSRSVRDAGLAPETKWLAKTGWIFKHRAASPEK